MIQMPLQTEKAAALRGSGFCLAVLRAVSDGQQRPQPQQHHQEHHVGDGEEGEVPALALGLLPGNLPVGDQAGHGGDQGAKAAQVGGR